VVDRKIFAEILQHWRLCSITCIDFLQHYFLSHIRLQSTCGLIKIITINPEKKTVNP